MQSPSANDARDYETTLALLGRVAPAMPADARSRAAWSVATAKLDLKAAVAAEGFSLHTAPTVPAAPPALPTPAALAALASNIARTRAEIAALRAGPAAPPAVPVPVIRGEYEHIDDSKYEPSESLGIHRAAVILAKKTGSGYREAVEKLTRRTA